MLPYSFTKIKQQLKTRVKIEVYKVHKYDKIWNDVR